MSNSTQDRTSNIDITRRSFLSQTAGATAAVSLLGKKALADTAPKKGGDLVLALNKSSTGDSLDPALWSNNWIETLGYQWGNGLVEAGPNGKLLPELAESWEANQQFTKWVFKLRRGVQFHNGKEMTAEDVVASIDHHRGANSQSGGKSLVASVTDNVASDKYEVTLTLDSPNGDFPYNFSDCRFIIMPAGGDFTKGVGTGGYVLEKFEPGVRAFARRNPNYWKADRAHADTVETLGMNDATARLSALISKSAHFIDDIAPNLAKKIQATKSLQLLNVPTAMFYSFTMLCDTPPFDNKDVRLALKYAIDRDDVISRTLGGFGTRGNDQPIGPTFRYYAPDIPQHGYDPDKAKFHLKKSGYTGPLTLSVSNAGFPGAVDSAEVFRSQANAAGIPLNVTKVPEDGYWQNVWMKNSFCATYWTGRTVEDMILSISLTSDAPYNETHWKSPKFDKLLVEARVEHDEDRRRQLYREIQELVSDDGGCLNFAFANALFATAGNVKGFVESPAYTGFRVAEQLYFTS